MAALRRDYELRIYADAGVPITLTLYNDIVLVDPDNPSRTFTEKATDTVSVQDLPAAAQTKVQELFDAAVAKRDAENPL